MKKCGRNTDIIQKILDKKYEYNKWRKWCTKENAMTADTYAGESRRSWDIRGKPENRISNDSAVNRRHVHSTGLDIYPRYAVVLEQRIKNYVEHRKDIF